VTGKTVYKKYRRFQTSGVPQNVDAVFLPSKHCLHRPKSVKATWPYKPIIRHSVDVFSFKITPEAQLTTHHLLLNYSEYLMHCETSKHRQSYRHADPRRQQQHTAVAARVTSNRSTVTVFLTVWPLPLTLWPAGQRMPATTIEYMCTKFGVDSSRRFPFRARTDRQRSKQTRLSERPTHDGGYTAGVGNY